MSNRSLRTNRDPVKYYLHQYRESKKVFKPLYEVFICYGQEEFFDCKDEVEAEDGKKEKVDLNFPLMVEKKHRELHRQQTKEKSPFIKPEDDRQELMDSVVQDGQSCFDITGLGLPDDSVMPVSATPEEQEQLQAQSGPDYIIAQRKKMR